VSFWVGQSSDPPSSATAKTLVTVPSSAWSVVATTRHFCGMVEVRRLASKYLEKWLVNPALVDQVKLLLQAIADHITEAPSQRRGGAASSSGDDGGGGTGGGRLIASDMHVIHEIVRLRSRLKTSQTEMHRQVRSSPVSFQALSGPIFTTSFPMLSIPHCIRRSWRWHAKGAPSCVS